MFKVGIFCIALICVMGLEEEESSITTEKPSSHKHGSHDKAPDGNHIQKSATREKIIADTIKKTLRARFGHRTPSDSQHIQTDTKHGQVNEMKVSASSSAEVHSFPIHILKTDTSGSCGPYEEYKDCGPSCEPKCADGPKGIRGCVDRCKKGCFCMNGLLRHENGSCVFVPDCQNKEEFTCPENEYFSVCGQPPTCRTCSNPRECPIYACSKRCTCLSDHLRTTNGSCIPMGHCPKPQGDSKCPLNEEIVPCVKPEWCNSCEIRGNCKLNLNACQEGCDCKAKHFRNEYGFCVPAENCSKQTNSV